MIEIPLRGTKAQGRKAKIDDEDLDLVKGKRWIYHQGYAVTKDASMHRLIAGCTDPNRIVDHINGDRLDNRRENLRIVSRLDNYKNKKLALVPTEHEGIKYDQFAERYLVILYEEHRRRHFGKYKTIEQAVSVRDAEVKHGGFKVMPSWEAYRSRIDTPKIAEQT